jgi:hypothetical protein
MNIKLISLFFRDLSIFLCGVTVTLALFGNLAAGGIAFVGAAGCHVIIAILGDKP